MGDPFSKENEQGPQVDQEQQDKVCSHMYYSNPETNFYILLLIFKYFQVLSYIKSGIAEGACLQVCIDLKHSIL